MSETKKLHQALIYGSSAHRKACRSEFAKFNLSEGQPKVLSVLSEQEGFLQKDLAKRCHVEPATMTSILNSMEKKGLIRRAVSHVSGGKRAFSVFLTEQGRTVAETVNNIVSDIEAKAFIGFTQAEQDSLIDYLNRIGENLEVK